MADLNKLITRLTTVTELKQLLIEIQINNSDKISKVSDESVLNAFDYSIAKIAQKQLKDTAILESVIFPESASGDYLDRSASLYGGLTRLGSSASSTFIRVKAADGTQYIPGIHIFNSNTGVQFEVTDFVTIGVNGWGYVPVRSINFGSKANSPAQSIVVVTPKPAGHDSCTNEYGAIGGREEESDESFKIRIRSYPNLQAQNTLDRILEVIRLYNPNILRMFNIGSIDDRVNLRLVLENGAFFSTSELSNILEFIAPYLCLTDIYPTGGTYGVNILNVSWKYIDMDFRVNIGLGYVTDDVRQRMQIAMTKYFDFRYWVEQASIQWDDMMGIVKNIQGVTFVLDEYFSIVTGYPRTDVTLALGELPRIRGFIMRDLEGNILFNSNSILSPIFYENGI